MLYVPRRLRKTRSCTVTVSKDVQHRNEQGGGVEQEQLLIVRPLLIFRSQPSAPTTTTIPTNTNADVGYDATKIHVVNKHSAAKRWLTITQIFFLWIGYAHCYCCIIRNNPSTKRIGSTSTSRVSNCNYCSRRYRPTAGCLLRISSWITTNRLTTPSLLEGSRVAPPIIFLSSSISESDRPPTNFSSEPSIITIEESTMHEKTTASIAASSGENNSTSAPIRTLQQLQPPKTICIHGIASRDMALNEAVWRIATLDSLQEANELIELGAVWARMEPLQPGDLLRQYDSNNNNNNNKNNYNIAISSSSSIPAPRLNFEQNHENDNDGNFAENEIDQEDDKDPRRLPGKRNQKDDYSANSRVKYADLAGGMSQPQPNPVKRKMTPNQVSSNLGTVELDGYIEQMEQQRYRRILSPGWIEAGTDLRIYRYPRRFAQACQQMTPDRIIYQDTTFIVVDKPPMLPVQPEASNYNECCPGCVQEYSGPFYSIQGEQIVRPLICHRVDSCVGGCVVLAKDQHGQKVFAAMQRDRQIRKLYTAISVTPVPLGRHVHWMWDYGGGDGTEDFKPPCQLIRHTPPESRRKAREYWDRCVLEVVSCEAIEIRASTLSLLDPTSARNGSISNSEINNEVIILYESTIRLVTGRKHQVRAQLASLGSPIWGDTLYMPMSGLTLDDEGVMEDDGCLAAALSQCRVPTAPIGLQAQAILFGRVRAKASLPWWKM